MSKDFSIDNYKKQLINQLKNLDKRIKVAFENSDASLVSSYAIELEPLLSSAILHFYSPGNGLAVLLGEYRLLSVSYLKSDKMKLLSYVKECTQRCLDIIDNPNNNLSDGELLPPQLFDQAKQYIRIIVNQINGTYNHEYYDACAVMVRRLIETLIIEMYENHSIESKVKDTDGNYFHLKELIDCTLSEDKWNLSRNSKQSLRHLKNIGDLSAHNRRYIATKNDINSIKNDLRLIVQELQYIS